MINQLNQETNQNYNLLKTNNDSFEKSNKDSPINNKKDSLFLFGNNGDFNLGLEKYFFNESNNESPNKLDIIANNNSSINDGDKNYILENQIEDNEIIIKKSNIKNENKNNKIFEIKKKKKSGRIKKYFNKKGNHDKFKKDNLIKKFKVHLMKNIFNYINSCFLINKNKEPRNHIKVIKNISYLNYNLISKDNNLIWFNTKIKDIFSQNISCKFSNFESNHNKNLINRIYKKREEKKVINIMEKTIKDMWILYIKETKDNNYLGFKTLKDDINDFKKNGETEEFIKKYKNISIEFEKIFNSIKTRKKKKKNQ